MTYKVELPVYEGPFDLLLHLTIQDEVDLYEVSLGAIVDAYLAELDKMSTLDLDVATEFLLIAATLIELKSRRLLPDEVDPAVDEEFSLWEERDLLLAKLLECKTYKDAARGLEALAAEAGQSFPRTMGLEAPFDGLVPDPLADITALQLRDAYERATKPQPKPVLDLFHVTPIKLTVAETVGALVAELPKAGRTSLRKLTAAATDRVEVVVCFLALLELYKQGSVELYQVSTFGTLAVEWIGGATMADINSVDSYEG